MALPQINMSRRMRTVLRYVGIVVVALIVFVLALQATFPYDRIKDRAVEALSDKWIVRVGDVERGFWPGSVTFKNVQLQPRDHKPDDPQTVYIDSIRVDLGVLALIGQTANVDLDVMLHNGNGEIKGHISLPKFGKGGFKLALRGIDTPGVNLPLRSFIGLPILGKLEFDVDMDVPGLKTKAGRQVLDWTHAEGDVTFGCPNGCTVGDGHTKLKPLLKNRSQQAIVGDGIEFGKLDIDAMSAEAKFTPAVGDPEQHSSGYKAGKFELTKLEVKSKDGELHVDYAMQLAQDLDDSIVTGCLRFNLSNALLATKEGTQTYTAITASGAERRPDGLFHIKLSDKLKDMKRLNLECGPNVKTDDGKPPVASRPPPSIQVMKDPPKTEPTKTEPPPPPPAPNPPAPGSAAPPGPGGGSASATINSANLGTSTSGPPGPPPSPGGQLPSGSTPPEGAGSADPNAPPPAVIQ